MTAKQNISARELAAKVLQKVDPRKNFAAAILNPLLHQTDERPRATDLVYGTIRNRTAIDHVITEFSGRKTDKINARLLSIIRAAVYEIVYAPKTPPHAAVNEAVEITKATLSSKQAGFANAVLRGILRHVTDRSAPLQQADPTMIIPNSPETGCLFTRPLLPDPDKRLADNLALAFSLPAWLVKDWMNAYGPDSTQQICFGSNRRPAIYLRPNPLKNTPAELAEQLQQQGIETEPAPNNMLKTHHPSAIADIPAFAEGRFTVQDLTASLPAVALAPEQNSRILDLCAAPGTKTTQLAEITRDTATIVATDLDPERLQKVRQNIDRLALNSINIAEYENLDQHARSIGNFDYILVDAPCSNTGVLAKRPEARYRLNPKAIEQLSETQLTILEKASAILRRPGRICYSTCSIEPAENTALTRQFLAKHPNFSLLTEKTTLPSTNDIDFDGGYYAILMKR